ncbi:FkbM family methyltransferase [Mycolicibacterium bacteremicum]|uniref:FkbM family methyltransferase n=1 Tax=Mycolicibacterium bacteremicum TaxID=564198 RepID=UPI0026EFDD0C|nr:FkbM family methyltransferase [Mycolicibacterium bacteremicum]
MSRIREKLGHTLALAQSVGLPSALNLVGRRALGISRPVTVRCGAHRLTVRPADSDPFVLAQIFTEREYDAHPFWMERLNAVAAGIVEAGKVPLIIDAGANVGYSALYLAQHFPDAVILAVEPDPGCVHLIELNCGTEPRIKLIHAAVWSHGDGVNLSTDDREGSWANRVSGNGTTPSVTLEQLIGEIPDVEPFILKLDIEGAESEVCRASPQAVSVFPCIMIEPHDWMLPGSGGLAPLYEAVAGKKLDTLIRDETLMLFDCAVLEQFSEATIAH